MPPGSFFNYGECRMVTKGDRMAVQRVLAAACTRANVLATRGATGASLLTFSGGDGAPFLSVHVFNGKFGANGTVQTNFVLNQSQTRT